MKDLLLRCSGPCSRTSLFSSNLGFGTCSYVHFFFIIMQRIWLRDRFCVSVSTVTEGGSMLSCCQMSAFSALQLQSSGRKGYVDLGQTKGSTTLWTGISASR